MQRCEPANVIIFIHKSELDYTSDKITSVFTCIHNFTP